MNKIAKYLNEHLLGEAVVNSGVRQHYSVDSSPLTYVPEMVVLPRVTNDIRKVARFTWQLAEKGHVLGITPRGSGSDKTGAAVGEGIVLATPSYMNEIFELDPKQKLVRVQPGATIKSINDVLGVKGLALLPFAHMKSSQSIGGAIANNSLGHLSGKYGSTAEWIDQLEVILANGDVLQTGRLSKRELSRVKGLPGYEGEIYRQIDNLIEDNISLIHEKLIPDSTDKIGYPGIIDVKRKDGSFDLTPLFAGSQGTLGVISEVIIKADFISRSQDMVVAAFENIDSARDAIDELEKLKPSFMNIFDSELFKIAIKKGKNYPFFKSLSDDMTNGVIIMFGFDDFGHRIRSKKIKRVLKLITRLNAPYRHCSTDEADELIAMRDVAAAALLPEVENESAPPIIDGSYVPLPRYDSFAQAVKTLAKKHHVSLPLYGRVTEGIFYTRPTLQMHKVSDKQKIFKIIDQYCQIVEAHGGTFVAENGEGRLKSHFAYRTADPDVLAFYQKIRLVFDPYGTMNPGVKQEVALKELVAHLRSDYDAAPRPIGE